MNVRTITLEDIAQFEQIGIVCEIMIYGIGNYDY